MPSAQKTKGKSYENQVAAFLTEQFGEKFIRVPSSGAYLGGTNHSRREDMTAGQVRAFKGDIIPPDDWNHFNCETKFYKDFRFHLLYSEQITLNSWIAETEAAANPNDLNLIFMKFNRLGEYVAYQPSEGYTVNRYTVYNDSWHFTSLSQFWTPTNISIVHRRCTGTP